MFYPDLQNPDGDRDDRAGGQIRISQIEQFANT